MALRLPLRLPKPPGFDPGDLQTWPRVEGSAEYVDGELIYMPPSGDLQHDTCADVVGVLMEWRRRQPGFRVGTNEAGMMLGGDVRAADAAVWRADLLGEEEGRLRTVAPLLAVEVAGRYDDEEALRAKAAWYLEHGVIVVWLVFPRTRTVLVSTAAGELSLAPGDRISADPNLPGLEPQLADLFSQIDE
jgi:Uma2 family endonuclease